MRPQRPATLETRRQQLRLLATAIVKAGIAVEILTSLSALLQPATAAAGLQHLLDRNDGTSSPQISHLATFLPTLARRLDMPDEIVAKLRKMAAKLKVVQRGMAARHREALRAFDDEAAVKALLGLAAELVEEVLKVDRQGYREAKIIQSALAIELLLNAPVRIKNLASIEVDRHFVPVGRQDLHLRFPAHEVKNANDLEFPLMTETVDLLDLYLKVWRPILCDRQASPFLFPGDPPDRPKGKGTLSSQIKEIVRAHTRLDMPAHRFRHAAGKIFLDRNPGQYEVVRHARAQEHRDDNKLLRRRRECQRSPALCPHHPRHPQWRAAAGEPLMTRLCLRVEAWPPVDRDAWAAAHRRGGLLDDDGLAARWAPATSQIAAGGYGRFLSFLAEVGDLDQSEAPAQRITRPRVEAYIAHLRQQNHASTVAARILQLSQAARIMGSDADWKWLHRIRSRLRHMSSPARDDRPRLVPAATLSALWPALIQRAEHAENLSDRSRALLFRDGLMIAVLCFCPIRAKNMAAMATGRTLQKRGDEWWLAFASAEMKNKRPYEAPLPGLTPWFDRYIDHYRPYLAARSGSSIAGNGLWVSATGKPLSPKQVGQLVSRRTKRELGRDLNPHLFRKIVPTELAIHDPEHVGVARPLLGHADYRTTESAYNLGRAIDAVRRHHAVVRAIRADNAASSQPPPKARRPQLSSRGASVTLIRGKA